MRYLRTLLAYATIIWTLLTMFGCTSYPDTMRYDNGDQGECSMQVQSVNKLKDGTYWAFGYVHCSKEFNGYGGHRVEE